GEMSFTMRVDPVRQNHFTIKLWGSDPNDENWLILNVEGRELGQRHGGDAAAPDMLFGNKQKVSFAPNQWIYRTVALPIHLTRGKTNVALKIRSIGWISDYDQGPFFGAYNKLMKVPSLSIYRAYTHLGSGLDFSSEQQGSGVALLSPRPLEDESATLNGIKSRVNSQLANFLSSPVDRLKPWDLAWLARCYDARENLGENWIQYGGTNAAAALVQKVIAGIDLHVTRQSASGKYNETFGNNSWGGGFGGLGEAITLLWPRINAGTNLATLESYGGSYGSMMRTQAWSKALRTSVDFARFHRRGGTYANQDIYSVIELYQANRALLLVDPTNALLEAEAMRYLREAAGLLPWAGSDQPGGGPVPLKGTYPYGDSFYSITKKGTTRDNNGFVGSDYGEMGMYITRWGMLTHDTNLFNRGLQLLRARASFRFPAADDKGYRVMQAANPIGVRNREMPGHVGYLSREDGAVDIAALGPEAIGDDLIGYFQNGISDGQALRMIANSRDPYLPHNWAKARSYSPTHILLPMSPGASDFAWVDEENMAVAAKHGEDRLFANLNWAAPKYIGGWAKIFHLPAQAAPQIAEVQLDDLRYLSAGKSVTLGPSVEEFRNRQPFDPVVGAYGGVVFPTACRSDLAAAPEKNADAGRGTGYTLRFGHWLIGINNHHADTYDVLVPSNFASFLPIKDLVSGKLVSTAVVKLPAKSSAVFYLPDAVDPAPPAPRPAVQ
ncbi:MAG: hypothetical protein WCS94_22685, partial [Verrucomicrobiota bacterium]